MIGRIKHYYWVARVVWITGNIRKHFGPRSLWWWKMAWKKINEAYPYKSDSRE